MTKGVQGKEDNLEKGFFGAQKMLILEINCGFFLGCPGSFKLSYRTSAFLDKHLVDLKRHIVKFR